MFVICAVDIFIIISSVWWLSSLLCRHCACCCFFFQAEDGIRDLVRSRGLGDVYKRQVDEVERVFVEAAVALRRLVVRDEREIAARDVARRLSLIHI